METQIHTMRFILPNQQEVAIRVTDQGDGEFDVFGWVVDQLNDGIETEVVGFNAESIESALQSQKVSECFTEVIKLAYVPVAA